MTVYVTLFNINDFSFTVSLWKLITKITFVAKKEIKWGSLLEVSKIDESFQGWTCFD